MVDTARAPFTKEQSKEILKFITRECRDLLDLVGTPGTPDEMSQIIRNHFTMDMAGYGIPIEEYLDEISEEERIEIVNEVLAQPEYTTEPRPRPATM